MGQAGRICHLVGLIAQKRSQWKTDVIPSGVFSRRRLARLHQCTVEEVCAFQYNAINQAILDAKRAIPAAQWSEVFYEDLVRNPVESFRKLFAASGLPFDASMQAHCANVLDTPYNAFSEIRLDKWKDGRNREKIERVLPKVAAVASAMGYSRDGGLSKI